jgi:hypothetical protein
MKRFKGGQNESAQVSQFTQRLQFDSKKEVKESIKNNFLCNFDHEQGFIEKCFMIAKK